MISADAITSRTFTTVRFKEGYSTREVDDFLDEIVDRMACLLYTSDAADEL